MDGLGLDNMLGAEEVEKMFSDNAPASEETGGGKGGEDDNNRNPEGNGEQEDTTEVDFSDLLGQPSESVGSGEESEGNGGAPKSGKGQGTPQVNLFSSIAKALRDEGVFPDLSDDTLNGINDAATLKKMFDDEIAKSLDERQKRIESALNSGATATELQEYQQAMQLSQYLEKPDTYQLLCKEGADGDTLRKQMMYQDYVNRGFKPERAEKMVQKSFDEGTELDDAKEAFESCKEFYKKKVDDYQQEVDRRKQEQQSNQEKQYANLKKNMVDNDTFFGGVKVDKSIRQKAYDSITKPVFKDDQGNYMTALQKYQRENPIEFMQNVAMLFALTDEFKGVEKLTKAEINKGIKKGFNELESILNTSKRNSDGTLNLANTPPDDAERENWSLAM